MFAGSELCAKRGIVFTVDPSDSELRAARRRASYAGSVVKLGEDKPSLYAGKTPLERLALQTALVERIASLSGTTHPRIARADWPGEVFNIDERNNRLR
jgi:hypothetical protein